MRRYRKDFRNPAMIMDAKNIAIQGTNSPRASGARSEAQIARARYVLESGDIDGAAFHTEKPFLVAKRRKGTENQPPLAFLASFNLPECDVILPLKRGVTRVGLEAPFGDFELTRTRPIEARQWLIVQRRDQFWIMDDHSTNLSLVLPREIPKILDANDPRWSDDRYDYMKLREKALHGISLDWAGTVVHELREGDVLLTIYAALVFGGVGPGTLTGLNG